MTENIHSTFLINHLTEGFLEFVQSIPNFLDHFKIYEKYCNEPNDFDI